MQKIVFLYSKISEFEIYKVKDFINKPTNYAFVTPIHFKDKLHESRFKLKQKYFGKLMIATN